MFIVKRAEFQSHTAPKSKKRTWTEYVGVLVLCCIEWYTIKYNDQAFCYWDVLSKWCLSQKHWVVLVHDFFWLTVNRKYALRNRYSCALLSLEKRLYCTCRPWEVLEKRFHFSVRTMAYWPHLSVCTFTRRTFVYAVCR